ncbi:MAG: GT2 family glycosyltransferase/spore maturation protein CgeB, partial [Myxococcota bacterium]
WIDHASASWVNAPGLTFVSFDDLLDDPRSQAVRLASELDLPRPSDEVLSAVEAFTDKDLRRSTQVVEEAGPNLVRARAIWDLVRSHDPQSELLHALFDQTWNERNERRSAVNRLEVDGAADRATARRELEVQRRELGVQRRAFDEMRGQRDVTRAELRSTEQARSSLDKRLAESERKVNRRGHETQSARRAAARWEAEYERLRSRRSVRLSLGVAEQLRPVVRAVRSVRGTDDTFRRRSPAERQKPKGQEPKRPAHAPASQEQAAALTATLLAAAPGSDRTAGPLVSICVLNRDGADHLARLLPALAATTYRDFELVVVDNGSSDESLELLRSADVGAPVTLIENEQNASFSDGNNQAVAAADGDLVLLLNNDVESVGPGWLGRMVDTLEGQDAAAVGARLVYPRRPGMTENQGDSLFPDLTLQHRGVHFDGGVDGVPRGRNLGAGEDPMSNEACAVTELPAVTAACMLVRRDAYDAVGGLMSGYLYGTEDVDLCLRLRANGGRIVYDGQAVLWHHEYGTQNASGREVKRRNRIHNREMFVDHWGSRLYRQVMLDQLSGKGGWSDEQLHVAITVTKDDPDAGYGDYYTAHELGDALVDLGFNVSYVERYDDRWYDLADDIDVLVVLLDGFELRRVSRSVLSVAWVRNWTERWIEKPWFSDFDLVLASSATTRDLIQARTSKAAHLFPLATNPARFSPTGEQATSCLGVFTGNYWDAPRAIIPALRALPDDVGVRVHGSNWEGVEGVVSKAHGPVDYESLPKVYRGASAVIDDTAAHAAPYHAVNSRVFDALATGTPVITDNPVGLAELLGEGHGDDLLVWSDGASLQQQLQWVRDNPDEALARAQRWREIVLRDHTYDRRAAQLRELLVGHVSATRVGIAIGVPHDDQRPQWGDEHFARDVQRQLEQRGYPCRVFILPEWEQAYTAREDVMLHLFGLSELRTRSGQTNVLWNISHPELVTPELVDRYDIVCSAGSTFAEQLSAECATPVHYLPQATEPARFVPQSSDAPQHQLLFVGNSRKVHRKIIDDTVAVLAGLGNPELAIYGADWTPDLVDQRHVAASHVDNDKLHAYYAAADVVLNDHWDDMREHGFLSNRLYDALAAGAFVVSDFVDGVDEQFDGAVVTYRNRAELAEVLTRYLADDDARRALAAKGRATVLAQHTFGHRVDRLRELFEAHREEADHDGRVVGDAPASQVGDAPTGQVGDAPTGQVGDAPASQVGDA